MLRKTLRDLAAPAALLLLAASPAAETQQTGRVYRVGILDNAASPRIEAFREELRTLGWVEGQNLVIKSGIGPDDRLPALAGELVRAKVDVIFAPSTTAVQAATSAARSIPIVMATAADPVGSGFAATLSHPGGNITGLTSIFSELSAKRLELLRQVVPSMTRVAVLASPRLPYTPRLVDELAITAKGFGVLLQINEWSSPDDLESAFLAMNREHAEAVLVLPNPANYPSRIQIANLALKHRLPLMSLVREYAEAGALMAYGPSLVDLYRRAAIYVDKILRGARPSELPIEQPSKFELAINMKTAKALGLTIRQSLLLRADEVIQ